MSLVPGHGEARGLLALMELQSSRLAARVGPDGEPVLLADQDRTRWDAGQIARGLRNLSEAEALSDEPGPYTLQAAIAGCHARAASTGETDWVRIAELYERLARRTGSAVVEVNRAVALAWRTGRRRGYGWSTSSSICRRCATTTCCRACAATCWPGSAGRRRRGGVHPGRALAGNERERALLTGAGAGPQGYARTVIRRISLQTALGASDDGQSDGHGSH